MRFQWQYASGNEETDTHAFWFNHQFMGWITLPKTEMKSFVKLLHARYRKVDSTPEVQEMKGGMKIKSGQEIEVTFYAKALEDIDSYIFMDWLMDNISGFRVFNPSYREIEKNDSTPPATAERK